MNILFFEDNAQADILATKVLMDEYKDDVYLTDRYSDFMEWMEIEPGAESFKALFVDLNVPRISLPKELRSHQPGVLSGWVFINEWLIIKYPFLQPRIILYSAYLDLLGKNAKKYHELYKKDPLLIKHMREIFNKIE